MNSPAFELTGEGSIAPPWETFADCRFHRALVAALEALGFQSPTPIQARCWPLAWDGRDVTGVAETGSGKTLAFLAPAFDQHLRTGGPGSTLGVAGRAPRSDPTMLVLAPTRELALQIGREAEKLGGSLAIRGCCIYGGLDFRAQLAALAQRPQLVVACPGRLLDLLQRRRLSLERVRFLVLDEADRMLDMGFIEDIGQIISQTPRQRQTLMFSATWPSEVQEVASWYTQSPVHVRQGCSGELQCNSRVHQGVCLCHSMAEKVRALVEFVQRLGPSDRVMVFVNRKAAISDLCRDLSSAGFPLVALHGDLDQQDREHSLRKFHQGECRLLVATDVASRGLDVSDVCAVVCFDAARDRESHVHRIGRTGRAGKHGTAVTLIAASSRPELQMARQIFGFIRAAGQHVDPALEKSIVKLLSEAHTSGNSAETFAELCDSSDEEFEDEEAAEDSASHSHGAQSLPWYLRALARADMGGEPSELGRRMLLPAPGHHEGAAGSGASDIGSVLSGTTYLQNPVEQLFGHAGARDISVSACQETVRSGCRLLTQDTNGQTSGPKPFRWMVLRRVPWKEILEASDHSSLPPDIPPGIDFVWHVVVHDLHRTKAGRVRIATNYFKSNVSMLYDYVKEAFQLLDENDDDPQIIQAAVANESVGTLLRLYFEAGDTQNPKHFHTMAKLNLWQAGTLLHHCCESGLVRCAEYLLQRHSPQTAPKDKPWLQLADPLLLEKTWKNSAFHSAAWIGQADVMAVLCAWAAKHSQEASVRRLFDKKKQTPMDLLEMRLKKIKGRGLSAGSYQEAFNSLAPIFGKRPRGSLTDVPLLTASAPGQQVLLTDKEDQRSALALPPGSLTMPVLAEILRQSEQVLASRSVDTLLLSRIDLAAAETAAEEALAAEEFLRLARWCRRVAFVNCSAPPGAAVALCRGAAAVLRRAAQDQELLWESLAFPSWSEVLPGGSEEFAEALWDLCAAVRETCGFQALQSIQLAAGTTTGYLPPARRHLPQVLMATLLVKPIARRLLGGAPDEWKETELWKRIGGSPDSFTCKNPFLKGPDTLERKLLDRASLAFASEVHACLFEGWTDFIEAVVDCLVAAVRTMPSWAPLVAGRPVDGEERGLKIVEDLADEALLYVLKMRRSGTRASGLPKLAGLVRPYINEAAELGDRFPKSVAYFRRNFRCQGTRGP